MKRVAVTLTLIGISASASACPFCNAEVMEGIYNSRFHPNLMAMLSAFIVLAVMVVVLTTMSVKRHRGLTSIRNVPILSAVPLTTASAVLGIGMGGFIDGIVMHQILQVHAMLSNKIAATEYVGKSVNMFWDGIFHFFCLLVVLTGVVLLWKLLFRTDVERSGKLLGGGLLLGWGVFNIVEGLINHQILKLHNVVELSPNHDIGNFIFLGISVVMLIAGFIIVNSRNKGRYQSTDNGHQNEIGSGKQKHLAGYNKVV